MAQLFDASTITRFSQEGEDHFNHDRPCILKRISVGITSGVPLVQLPDDILSIWTIIQIIKSCALDAQGHKKALAALRP